MWHAKLKWVKKSYDERSKQLKSKGLITKIYYFPSTSTSSNIVTNSERNSSEKKNTGKPPNWSRFRSQRMSQLEGLFQLKVAT